MQPPKQAIQNKKMNVRKKQKVEEEQIKTVDKHKDFDKFLNITLKLQ